MIGASELVVLFMIRLLARVGYVEGLSYLLLLIVALPMKYWFGLPQVMQVVLVVHVVLFSSYCVCLLLAAFRSVIPVWAMIFGCIGAMMPFGPFVFDQIVLEPKRQGDNETEPTTSA
ncbi:MAG: DUF3817 domain-containing protein [Reinekea sp.]|jgi:integral membrane protein|nr:DUF3817 domain-containing protein [Reinekea sp.]